MENISIYIFHRKGLWSALGWFLAGFSPAFAKGGVALGYRLAFAGVLPADWRQASEQYRTCSQLAAHFLRHVKGRWQTAQSLTGRL
jgi:hypothetical protein